MARPIEPTPVLRGKDAERLRRDLANVCSPEEVTARQKLARKALAELMRPKFAIKPAKRAARKPR